MTQSNDMPKEIYLFPSTQSIGDRGFTTTEPEKTCDGLDYTKYIRADLTPPQSPNRAVLDALKSIIFDIECLEPIKKMHLEDAYQAISDAEKECVDYETEIREFISEQFKEDGTPYIAEEKNCILLGMPVDANTADWFTKLRAFEHLKRQKGR